MKIPAWTLLAIPTFAFALGFVMNAICMYANGGVMPVLMHSCSLDLLNESEPMVHGCVNVATHLRWLSDWILLRSEGAYMSPGDFLELFGEHAFYPGIIAWFAARLEKDGFFS